MSLRDKYSFEFFKPGITTGDLAPDNNVICMHTGESRVYVQGKALQIHFFRHSIHMIYVDTEGNQERTKIAPRINYQWTVGNQRFEVIAGLKDVHGHIHFYFIKHTDLNKVLEETPLQSAAVH